MNAAQLFESAVADDPLIMPGIGSGDFKPLVAWLGEKVHGQASRYSMNELMTRATGRPLDHRWLVPHERDRAEAAHAEHAQRRELGRRPHRVVDLRLLLA